MEAERVGHIFEYELFNNVQLFAMAETLLNFRGSVKRGVLRLVY